MLIIFIIIIILLLLVLSVLVFFIKITCIAIVVIINIITIYIIVTAIIIIVIISNIVIITVIIIIIFLCINRLSAFVLKSFHQAKEHIYIENNILFRIADWIIRYQNPDGSFQQIGSVHSTSLKVNLTFIHML